MGVKEDGMWTGSIVFLLVWIVSAIVVGFYVRMQTKDRSQANDNMK
jgi:hypothetical protein